MFLEVSIFTELQVAKCALFLCLCFVLDAVAEFPVNVEDILCEEHDEGVTVGALVTGMDQVSDGEVSQVEFSLVIFVDNLLVSLKVARTLELSVAESALGHRFELFNQIYLTDIFGTLRTGLTFIVLKTFI